MGVPNVFDVWLLGDATSTQNTIAHSETEEIKWFNKRDLHLAMAGIEDSFKPARPGSIAHFLLLNWLADTLQ